MTGARTRGKDAGEAPKTSVPPGRRALRPLRLAPWVPGRGGGAGTRESGLPDPPTVAAEAAGRGAGPGAGAAAAVRQSEGGWREQEAGGTKGAVSAQERGPLAPEGPRSTYGSHPRPFTSCEPPGSLPAALLLALLGQA